MALLTINESARRLNCGPRQVHELIAAQILPAVNVAGRFFVDSIIIDGISVPGEVITREIHEQLIRKQRVGDSLASR
jgi:hypothetical protein